MWEWGYNCLYIRFLRGLDCYPTQCPLLYVALAEALAYKPLYDFSGKVPGLTSSNTQSDHSVTDPTTHFGSVFAVILAFDRMALHYINTCNYPTVTAPMVMRYLAWLHGRMHVLQQAGLPERSIIRRVVSYDHNARKAACGDQSVWDRKNEAFYAQYLETTGASFPMSRQTMSGGAKRPFNAHSEPCNLWNFASCRFQSRASGCMYAHVCASCGQNHKAVNCYKKLQRGAPRSLRGRG